MTPDLPSSAEDLARLRCETDPIHLIGQIQAGKALVAIDLASGTFSHGSVGTESVTGENLEIPPADWLGTHQIATLLRRVADWKGRGPMPVVVRPDSQPPIPCWAYVSDARLVIEWNFADSEPNGDPWDAEVRECLDRIETAPDLRQKLEIAVGDMRRLTGYDRVMVYRFLPDQCGEVIAEDRREDWEPYLGLRYPASDIPKPARQLFLLNDLRVICDVDAPPLEIRGAEPLDLSLSRYRQPAELHIEYLQNMGVAASLTSAIRLEGRLWGLVSCHHGTPKSLTARDQSRFTALTGHLAVDLAGAAREERLRSDLACARLANKLVQCVTLTDHWPPVMASLSPDILAVLDADGLALHFNDETWTGGNIDDAGWIDRLIARYGESRRNAVTASDQAREDYPDAEFPESIGGVLWISLSHFGNDVLVVFRRMQDRVVKWGGDPSSHGGLRTDGKLSPRRSFKAWTESVRGQSEPWSESDLEMANTIRATLIDVVITTQTFREMVETQAARRFRAAHHESDSALVFADLKGRVVYRNRVAESGQLSTLGNLDELMRWEIEGTDLRLGELASRSEPCRFACKSNGHHCHYELAALRDHGEVVGYTLREIAG